MKLHILKQGQEPVKGYETVFVQNDNLSLEHVSNNECEFILAPDIMDSFSAAARNQLVGGLVSKLRMGGTLVIGGTHVRLFSKAVLNGMLSHDQASDIIGSLRSMSYPQDVVTSLENLKLTINSVTMDGLHYEIKAVRTNPVQ